MALPLSLTKKYGFEEEDDTVHAESPIGNWRKDTGYVVEEQLAALPPGKQET